ncbi:MAG: ABC transporter permease [Eubacteriales bacterium]|nr:ABC transporter permease [Eubacteriales bacterium]
MSKLKENLRLAFSSIKSKLVRSLLTMLGIIVGIAAVMSLVAVGKGVQQTILGNFEKIGASTVVITPDWSLLSESNAITEDDIEALRKQVPLARYVAPLSSHTGSARSGDAEDHMQTSDNFLLYAYGMDIDGFNLLKPSMIYGRSLSPMDYQDGLPNCLIDEYSATIIYGDASLAVGQTLEVELSGGISGRLNIVGVGTFDSLNLITGVAEGLMSKQDQKDLASASVFTPLASLGRLSGNPENAKVLFLMAEEAGQAENAGNLALQILERRHNSEGQGNYRLQTMSGIVEQLDSSLGLMSTLISVVASISLLVAGIGVMNVMLINVTERTREVGIRKVLGATPNDITLQFLAESVILTSIGGVIGIFAGFGLARVLAAYMHITPKFSLGWSAASLLVSAAIGLIFGIAPAKRAANMNPIDALRYE